MNGSLLEEAEEHLARRRLHRAELAFGRAEAAGEDPDQCSAGRWMVHMLGGRYEQAWQQSDAIRARGAEDPHRFWRGEAIAGSSVMVRSLHGFGDAVQSFRFLPAVRALATYLTLEVAPELVPLAECIPGPDRVIAWGAEAPAYDVQVEVTELPYICRATAHTLPPPTRISLPPALCARAGALTSAAGHPAVGLVWSPAAWNTKRAVPQDGLFEATRNAGCDLWNLQGGAERMCAGGHLLDAPELCSAGILPMAAMLRSLDLVITVDTLAAHLAASLGTPTWLLLQKEADWRWMAAGLSSPWYPAMRLFRNSGQDGWDQTLARVRSALVRFSTRFRSKGRAA